MSICHVRLQPGTLQARKGITYRAREILVYGNVTCTCDEMPRLFIVHPFTKRRHCQFASR